MVEAYFLILAFLRAYVACANTRKQPKLSNTVEYKQKWVNMDSYLMVYMW